MKKVLVGLGTLVASLLIALSVQIATTEPTNEKPVGIEQEGIIHFQEFDSVDELFDEREIFNPEYDGTKL